MKKFYRENVEGCIKYEEIQPPPSKDGHEFVLITNVAELKVLHFQRYNTLKGDGEDWYTENQADLYLKIQDGTYTEQEVFDFENHIKIVSDAVVSGNWLTSQSICSALATSGIFDTAKKLEIQTYIDDYVTNNY